MRLILGIRVGVNTYAFEILWNLWKLQEEWGNRHNLIVYLKNEPLPDMPKETQNFKYKIIPGGGLWIITKLMPDLFFGKPRPDVFFLTKSLPSTFCPHASGLFNYGPWIPRIFGTIYKKSVLAVKVVECYLNFCIKVYHCYIK